jgi:hypothetical protein
MGPLLAAVVSIALAGPKDAGTVDAEAALTSWREKYTAKVRAAGKTFKPCDGGDEERCLCANIERLRFDPPPPGSRINIRYPYLDVDGLSFDIEADGRVSHCKNTHLGEPRVELEESGVFVRIPNGWNKEAFALRRVESPPPRTLEEAITRWMVAMSRGKAALASGPLEGGGFYGMFRHTVRDGMPAGPGGMHKHFLLEITELMALVPISDSAFVECSHNCERDSEERCAQALEICRSMQKKR